MYIYVIHEKKTTTKNKKHNGRKRPNEVSALREFEICSYKVIVPASINVPV